MNIFTGSYSNCKKGNLVSISADKGKDANFVGNCYTLLAPKRDFFVKWKHNTTLSEDENNIYYMIEFYDKVLSNLTPQQVLEDLNHFGEDVVILCYEDSSCFCHRHLVATWLERNLQITVPEVAIDEKGEMIRLNRNSKYIQQFNKIMNELKTKDS